MIVGTDMWFVGGYVGDHPGPGYTHVWIYHTTSDTWTRGPDLPQPRGAGAAALVGSTIYFAGGMDRTRTIDEYHPLIAQAIRNGPQRTVRDPIR